LGLENLIRKRKSAVLLRSASVFDPRRPELIDPTTRTRIALFALMFSSRARDLPLVHLL